MILIVTCCILLYIVGLISYIYCWTLEYDT
jgi:hypothetical protein